jgi:hypothetical protein
MGLTHRALGPFPKPLVSSLAQTVEHQWIKSHCWLAFTALRSRYGEKTHRFEITVLPLRLSFDFKTNFLDRVSDGSIRAG